MPPFQIIQEPPKPDPIQGFMQGYGFVEGIKQQNADLELRRRYFDLQQAQYNLSQERQRQEMEENAWKMNRLKEVTARQDLAQKQIVSVLSNAIKNNTPVEELDKQILAIPNAVETEMGRAFTTAWSRRAAMTPLQRQLEEAELRWRDAQTKAALSLSNQRDTMMGGEARTLKLATAYQKLAAALKSMSVVSQYNVDENGNPIVTQLPGTEAQAKQIQDAMAQVTALMTQDTLNEVQQLIGQPSGQSMPTETPEGIPIPQSTAQPVKKTNQPKVSPTEARAASAVNAEEEQAKKALGKYATKANIREWIQNNRRKRAEEEAQRTTPMPKQTASVNMYAPQPESTPEERRDYEATILYKRAQTELQLEGNTDITLDMIAQRMKEIQNREVQ